MNGFVYNLPPANVPEVKCEKKDLQGYLELEVSLINFITTTNTSIKSELNSRKLPAKTIISIVEKQRERISKDTPLKNVIINNNYKNSASVNEISKEIVSSIQNHEVKGEELGISNRYNSLDSVQVKIVWCGERTEDAANISISCKTQQTLNIADNFKLKSKRKYNQHLKRHHQDQKHKQHLLLSANNKLRYRICTSGALFLEYLRSCKPIEIIVTGGSSGSCSTTAKPLGQAQFRLPLVLLKKFNHNIVKGHNFEYKTKVYTLYKQNQESVDKTLIKSGEIQLRFKMLFAPTAAASATAVATAQHGNVIHEKHHHCHLHHNHRHHLGGKATKVPEVVQGRFNIDFYYYVVIFLTLLFL